MGRDPIDWVHRFPANSHKRSGAEGTLGHRGGGHYLGLLQDEPTVHYNSDLATRADHGPVLTPQPEPVPAATTTTTTNLAAVAQQEEQAMFAQECNTPAKFGEPNVDNPDGLQRDINCPVGTPAFPYVYGYKPGPIETIPVP